MFALKKKKSVIAFFVEQTCVRGAEQKLNSNTCGMARVLRADAKKSVTTATKQSESPG